MLLAVLVIIGKYTDLKDKRLMYAFCLFVYFVCFNWPKWVLLFLQCDEVLLCTERWTGFFLIHTYIYIFWGGWGGFLTLDSIAVKQCTLGGVRATKRLFCLLWFFKKISKRCPLLNLPPGVQAELISGFIIIVVIIMIMINK